MTVKEYLSQYLTMVKTIDTDSEKLCNLCDLVLKITASTCDNNINTSIHDSDKIGRIVPDIIDLTNKIKLNNQKLIAIYYDISEIIDTVNDVESRQVLIKHYIGGKTFSKIADDLDCSERWVYKIHKKALELLKKSNSSL